MPHTLVCHQSADADYAQLYEILVNELTDFVVFLMDPTGCIVSWNPAVEQVFGYTKAEWLGQSAEIIFTPEDREQKRPQKELAMAIEAQCARDVRWHLRKNGERVYIEGSTVALKGPEGTLLGFSKVMRDITERKRAEDLLLTAQTRFQALIRASSDVLYRMNHDWTEMRQLGGNGFIADTPAPSKDWLRQYIHPDDQRVVLEAIHKAIQKKSIFDLEHRVLRVDNTLGWTHSRAVPLLDEDGTITEWFGAATDITPRKTAEVDRELYLAKLARSNGELSQFAHVLSHDLKTSIRGIKSFSQLLSLRYGDKINTEGQEYLRLVQGSADSMYRLVETLLGYAVVGQKEFSLNQCRSQRC